MSGPALSGLRILDLTQVAAGPYATFLLGFLGAEVIKVESCRRPDIARGPTVPRPNQYQRYPGRQPGDQPWNRDAHHAQRNRNKLSLTLDLTEPAGKALLLRLLPLCDALIENYRASVMDRWGLGWEVLRSTAPHLIYVKLSSQGNTGPERDYGSLGLTLECTAGLASVTGYPDDGRPRMTNEVYPDPVVGVLAVGALMAALRHRQQTGQGCLVDLSQREVTTALIGDAVLDYSMNGRVPAPIGNRHPWQAPHGVYPCRGEDAWVAIAVAGDEDWAGLRRALGDPDWAADQRFADSAGRWHHQDEIDARLSEWTKQLGHYEAMERLQAEGVAAGAVLKGSEVVVDPHLAARGWWDRIDSPDVGREYAYVGAPWVFGASPRPPGHPAPPLGAHNEYVLGELLGLSAGDLAELEAKGIIGTVPTQVESSL